MVFIRRLSNIGTILAINLLSSKKNWQERYMRRVNREGPSLVWKTSGPRKGMEFESPALRMIKITTATDEFAAIRAFRYSFYINVGDQSRVKQFLARVKRNFKKKNYICTNDNFMQTPQVSPSSPSTMSYLKKSATRLLCSLKTMVINRLRSLRGKGSSINQK